MNGDGKADIVGFGQDGVWVSLATGGGNFAAPKLVLDNFGSSAAAGGWSSNDQFPRVLGDVNGDGKADIVGFGYNGVWVAHGNTSGGFDAPTFDFKDFGFADTAGGWTSADTYPRAVADVSGDHAADLVGFGAGGVFVAISSDHILK